jgi:hypothetical protein
VTELATARGFPMLNKAGAQEQEVCTPLEIIEAVTSAWDGSVALDPCAPSEREPSFFARRRIRYGWGLNGLGGLEPDLVWPDRTFVNPPFDDLRPWLEKAMSEHKHVFDECPGLVPQDAWRTVLLLPFRAHRPWFQDAIAHAASSGGGLTILPGIRFVGHKSIFPAPVCLLSWGVVVPFGPASLIAQPRRP